MIIETYADLLSHLAEIRRGEPITHLNPRLVPHLRKLICPITVEEISLMAACPVGFEVPLGILLGVSPTAIRNVREGRRWPDVAPATGPLLENMLEQLDRLPTPEEKTFAEGCPKGHDRSMSRALGLPVLVEPKEETPEAREFLTKTIYGNVKI